jgi:hypothetical protein
MKRALVVTTLLVASTLTAFAGKEERDIMTKEVTPAIQDAQAKFKSSCGCPISITVDSSLVSKDELYKARNMAEDVSKGAVAYCTDGASKKAVCQMKTLTFAKAKDPGFSFKGGAGLMTTDGNAEATWEMITRELDK